MSMDSRFQPTISEMAEARSAMEEQKRVAALQLSIQFHQGRDISIEKLIGDAAAVHSYITSS
jgi:hypothetical protein